MNQRFLASLVALAAAALPHLSGQTPTSAQKKPVAVLKDLAAKTKAGPIPRTPDGHPDLQGIWTNATLTPLERPAELTGKLNITDAEATAYERRRIEAANADRRDAGPETDVGSYNEVFFDRGAHLVKVDGSSRTSLIIDPPDGKIPPLTPEAQKKVDDARAAVRMHPADRPSDRSLAERCILWRTAGPPMMPGPYNNEYEIVQTPGYVTILVEMIHDARIIPLDGSKHLSPDVQLWMGDPRGHWEGDTLVVDTTNFTDKTRFSGSSDKLHLVERFTRVDANTILYKFTVDDPSAFTKPWTAEYPLRQSKGPVYEYACHEGNYALLDILRGARQEESAAAQKGKK
jgi:hypothetical protein